MLGNITSFRSVLLFLCALLSPQLLAAPANNPEPQKTTAPRPNFVWLISEDNSLRFVKLFERGGADMPTLDSFAEQGIVFTNAYANAPVCSVARSTLALGAYAPRLAVNYHRALYKSTLPDDLLPLSQLLQDAGYYTSNNAKEDYNFIKTDQTWSASGSDATWRSRQDKQPFFHVQTFHVTHESSMHFPSSDLSSSPTQHDPKKVVLDPHHPDTALFRYSYARYLDQHLTLEKQLKQLVDKLDEDGLLDTTFIFYFGDHGGTLPGSKGYLGEAGLKIPLVVRVPKHFRHLLGEGFNANGQRVDGLVSFVDFAATVTNLAGLDPVKQHDGHAFLGANVSLKDVESRDTVLTYADRFDEKMDFVRSLRVGKYKYIRSYMPFYPDALYNEYRYLQAAYQEWYDLYKEGKLNDIQSAFFKGKTVERLYDLSSDPYETRDLASDKQYEHVLLKMRHSLRDTQEKYGDFGFYPESYLAQTHAFDDPQRYLKTHKAQLTELMDISDLVFTSGSNIRKATLPILKSKGFNERFWALTVLTSTSQSSRAHRKIAKSILANASDAPLLRAKALEYLVSIGKQKDAATELVGIYKQASCLDAVDILNIATYLKQAKNIVFDKSIEGVKEKACVASMDDTQQGLYRKWIESRVTFLVN